MKILSNEVIGTTRIITFCEQYCESKDRAKIFLNGKLVKELPHKPGTMLLESVSRIEHDVIDIIGQYPFSNNFDELRLKTETEILNYIRKARAETVFQMEAPVTAKDDFERILKSAISLVKRENRGHGWLKYHVYVPIELLKTAQELTKDFSKITCHPNGIVSGNVATVTVYPEAYQCSYEFDDIKYDTVPFGTAFVHAPIYIGLDVLYQEIECDYRTNLPAAYSFQIQL